MKRSILILLLLAAAAPLAAWDVVHCNASTAAKRNAFAAKVRAAKLGDPLYVRIPFPSTDSEVWTDLVDQFIAAYAGKSSARFTPIAEAMVRGAYRYQVLRVADWSPARCADAGNRGDFYHLVIIRDAASGADVVRVSVNENGLVGTVALPGATEHPIPLIEVAASKVSKVAMLGARDARDAQYVTTWGSLECHPLLPCVALRNDNELYFVRGDDVFQVQNGRKFSSLRTEQQRAKFNASLGPDDRYASLGGDYYIVAKVLGRDSYVKVANGK